MYESGSSSDRSAISQVFVVDGIFILWQISAGYFKRFVHDRHERLQRSSPMKSYVVLPSLKFLKSSWLISRLYS